MSYDDKVIFYLIIKTIFMPNYLIMTQKELNMKSIMDKLVWWYILEWEAASLAHKSLRQIQRIKKRYKEEWDIWLINKSRLRKSNHQYDATKYNEAISIIQKYYHDYSYVMIYEKLTEKHSIFFPMATIRNELLRRWIRTIKKQKKIDKQRTMRIRKENYWEMIQYDWSYHLWFENRWGESCLLVSVDDATWDVVARFNINEWIDATFEFWIDYILTYWKPKSIYLDKFSTYKINHPNATDDKDLVTQFGRVCKELWIVLIFANSPEGKWRVERMNATLQDRLVKELREANISDIKEANIFLKEIFLPKFNEKFSLESRGNSDLHIPLRIDEKERLNQIFSVQMTRKVKNDYTISFETKIIQLYRNKEGWSMVYKWEQVTVEKWMDWSLCISNKNRKYIISKEVDIKLKSDDISRKSYNLPLPPVEWEDENKIKELLEKESTEKKIREKIEKEEARLVISKKRQIYYKEFWRLAGKINTITLVNTNNVNLVLQN